MNHPRYPPSSAVLQDLRDFQKWKNVGKCWTLFAYAANNLTLDLAIAITEFLFPDFEEIDGYILAKLGRTDKEIRYAISQWEEQIKDDVSKVEKALNHFHILDLLPCLHSACRDTVIYFGEFLLRCWNYELKERFPNKTIIVEGGWSEEDDDFVFTFYQKRESTSLAKAGRRGES